MDSNEKTAGTPFAAKMFFAMATMGLARQYAQQQADQRAQAQRLNMIFEGLQGENLQDTRQGLQYTRPPAFIAPPGTSDPNAFPGMPLGFDQGMVRMASIASEVGRQLAGQEKAALSLPGGLAGATGKLLGVGKALAGAAKPAARLGALGVGALGVGAYAASKPVLGYLSKQQEHPTWGATAQGAPQLAYGVNQYGTPQLGSPFVQ